jgi:hypothetical protein
VYMLFGNDVSMLRLLNFNHRLIPLEKSNIRIGQHQVDDD